uniref:RNA-directed DNA polymerase, eukaryota, reverse transcriptase zinc-binding domain protein n=1 Tax=Tanacetum cinerariifolium TaxID=118510 RepID=A0A6L2LJ56_TANCI|nr:RNA-directed DNA polymerase, eukaryota, reverse transcriptase zinc-binding domain protein [Tanacetum cinerariifolium]
MEKVRFWLLGSVQASAKTKGTRRVLIESDLALYSIKKLSIDAANFMVSDICDEEIKEAMFQIDNNKAPGPDAILMGFGFHEKMAQWIVSCVTTASYVFVERVLDKVKKMKDFKYHFGCKKMKLTHVFFVSDLLMFYNGNKDSASVLKEAIEKFRSISGLFRNYNRSIIIFGSMSEEDKQEKLECVPFKLKNFLSFPISCLLYYDVALHCYHSTAKSDFGGVTDWYQEPRLRKESVKKLVKRRVAKAIEEYEKTRADSFNAGGSGSASTGGSADMQGSTKIQKMEQELWTLTLKGDDIKAYNNRFHELALMCPELVPTKRKKIEKYVRGFPKRIKGNITSSKSATLHNAINMARELVEQAVQGHFKDKCPKGRNQQNEGARGRAYVVVENP